MFKKFLIGVCYFPEHWHPSRHESDIARIARAGFEYVRMGEGAWNVFEPHEGAYQFELFDRVIGFCRKHGVKVVLGTPTYAGPAWVSQKYPEVLRWNFGRLPMTHGSRRNFNYTSAKYLELSDKLCTALAEHYAAEKQVIAWQLDNEFNCHMDVSYAPSDVIAFRAWLKDKYRTLNALNRAWGTAFWAQTYDAWEQIDLPHPTATYLNPTTLLDESRFISAMVGRFAERQAKILRQYNPEWLITHNALFANVDPADLMKPLDFFSHDQYPLFYSEWTSAARGLVLSRSLSFPFGVMEQQAGPGGQMEYLQATPRAGQIRLWTWQSIGHGAKMLGYFRWRTCPFGSEQHWHGLIDADDKDSRRLTEATQVAEEIKRLPADFLDAPVVKAVGVLRDYDDEINHSRINTYARGAAARERDAWQGELMKMHVPVDQVWPAGDWNQYPVLIAGHLKIVPAEMARKFEKYVRSGGTLILCAQAGMKDTNAHVVELPLPGLLRTLAGVKVEDWTTLAKGETRSARLAGGQTLVMDTFVERLRPLEAERLGAWETEDSLLSGSPAVTRNRVGKGAVYYIGGYLTAEAVATWVQIFSEEGSIAPVLAAPSHVEAISRRGKQSYLVLLNHSANETHLTGLNGKDLLGTKPTADGTIVLPPFGVVVLKSSGATGKTSSKPKVRKKPTK